MALKPWYKVVTPREDLREGKPLDASEFAVHLDQVRDGRAPAVYQKPEHFFERTFLTKGLTGLAAEVIRRLSGERTETSAVFNMTTQFGGGKTHSLTLLYHLANNGPKAKDWQGVSRLLQVAKVNSVPAAKVAVFVGTEFDPIAGRGGKDGTPMRKTPWGEIAFQIGGEKALAVLAEHERQGIAPGGDVIRAFLPEDKPVLILMDELMNFVSRSRKSGMAAQLYSFLHNLSEEARGRDNMVLAVSVPASELEMSAEDQSDYERLKKLLDRVGKAVIMSAESETSEIIRRRLFEWDENAVSADGKVLLNRDAISTCNDFGDWVKDHRQQIPEQFPFDGAREAFAATYPFHPTVLSVFERKWQALPRFQQTRGVLRLLALWVSRAFQDGFKGGHKDPLIGLGTAPLDDPQFRAAMFEQLGEHRLEAAVTTDVCGKKDSHAVRLDVEAVDTIQKARLHRKVATTIFFESNGGMSKTTATIPEIRLAVSEPEMDIGNVETVLEALTESCYYLTVERNRYHFSFKENLNKRYADRRANVRIEAIDERVRAEIQKVFAAGTGVERIYYPERSNQVPDRATLALVVLAPEQSMEDEKRTKALVESILRESGTSARTFKSALIFCAAQSAAPLREDARRLLAWNEIHEDLPGMSIDETQRHQLEESIKKSQRDLKENVWRTYKNILLLGKDNELRVVDLGLVTSSAAENLLQLVLTHLRQSDDIQSGISPNFLVRNWPPAFKEWSTRAVRDAFYASPLFPRLLSPDAIKDTIARGVASGQIAYVAKTPAGKYHPFLIERTMDPMEVEISDEVFIITREVADAYREAQKKPEEATPAPILRGADVSVSPTTPTQAGLPIEAIDNKPGAGGLNPSRASGVKWTGEIPAQKWMNFYTKVLTRLGVQSGLKLTVSVEYQSGDPVSKQKLDEVRNALRELGLSDKIE
jgi:predicted AAA+ superfamily ATPase